MPIKTVERIVARGANRYNVLKGRCGQGARGRSYQAVFDQGTLGRIPRRPTAQHLYLASLVYKPVAVDRDGKVKVNGWVYGSYSTQQELLPWQRQGDARP